ncbi:MAG: polysaccharide deacetylase [Lachnospiraceae bacterium]|nr:polysaccharide deacetylase [Lachnospiraceae bacterium]
MEASEQRRDTDHKKKIARLRRFLIAAVLFLCILPTVLSFLALQRIARLDQELLKVEAMLSRLSAEEGETAPAPRQAAVGPTPPEGQTITQPEEETEAEPVEAEEEPAVKKVYLTFDDGPSMYTDDILDTLDEYGVKATFFVNGHEGYEAEYCRIVNEGHSLGMHSYSHDYRRIYSDLDGFADDLYQIQRLLEDTTGVESLLYRFPGGSSNEVHEMDMQRCIDYLEAKGIRYFDWNVSSGDALGGQRSVSEIVNSVLTQTEAVEGDTVVVLFHDAPGKRTTVEALPIIIERLQAIPGVELLPITEETSSVQHILSESK